MYDAADIVYLRRVPRRIVECREPGDRKIKIKLAQSGDEYDVFILVVLFRS
jgi:hypothetical protein